MWLLCALLAQETFTASSNFSADLYGKKDTRPSTWGYADVATWKVTFKPPAGSRVLIIKISGDVVAWPIGSVAAGRKSGVLFGLLTTEPEGSVRADWAADNTFLYIQDATGGEARRAPFSSKINRLLPADHSVILKVASWLNDTGRKIHIEPTITWRYQWKATQ